MGITESLKRGTIELLLLSLLQEQDMYGYELCQTLRERSEGLFVLHEGTMYPSLYRLEEKGLISDESRLVGKRRTRVYYHLEPEGKKYLAELKREYFSLNRGVMAVLEKTNGGEQE